MPAKGTRQPYRAVPGNFVALWPSIGWSAAEAVWQAHARTIARWVDECGRDRMVLARHAYLQAERVIQGRARRKRYVLGRTLSPIGAEKNDGGGMVHQTDYSSD